MEQPVVRPAAPPVVAVYKVYCFAMAAVNVLGIAVPIWFGSMMGWKVDQGALSAAAGIAVVPFLAALFLPARQWAWALGFVLICAGMIRPWFLPVAVPLLIYWVKPDVKRYFGRKNE